MHRSTWNENDQSIRQRVLKPGHMVLVYSNQKEIEYISASNITAAVETHSLHLHNLPFSPLPPIGVIPNILPAFSPSFARFCDTRISSLLDDVEQKIIFNALIPVADSDLQLQK